MKTLTHLCAVIALCLVALGCASAIFPKKSQRDLDIAACTYGANVPSDMPKNKRKHYIDTVAVPACMRTKRYSDAEATP